MILWISKRNYRRGSISPCRITISAGCVSKWERGSSEPDLPYILELAERFHVSVDALIGFPMRGTDAETEADRIVYGMKSPGAISTQVREGKTQKNPPAGSGRAVILEG